MSRKCLASSPACRARLVLEREHEQLRDGDALARLARRRAPDARERPGVRLVELRDEVVDGRHWCRSVWHSCGVVLLAIPLQSSASMAALHVSTELIGYFDNAEQPLPVQHCPMLLATQSARVKPAMPQRLIAWLQNSVSIAVH
jgi:hypothetical protein